MTRLLALLVVALSGCATVQLGQDPQRVDRISVFECQDPSRIDWRGPLPAPVRVHRNDPAEQPRVVRVGFNYVRVFANSCYGAEDDAMTVRTGDYTYNSYLCGHEWSYGHEVEGHGGGMQHTEWQTTGGGKCAKFLTADNAGKYHAGDWDCVAANGFEWAEK